MKLLVHTVYIVYAMVIFISRYGCFILCFVCFNLFCKVWVCVCVGFVMCGSFDKCVGVLVKCVLVFTVFCIVCTVFLNCFFYVYYLFCLY